MEQTSRILQIERLELKAIMIEFIVFAGVAMGFAIGFVSHLSMFLWMPSSVLSAIGLVVLGLVLIPVQSLLARGQGVRKLSTVVRIACCLISVFAYLAISSQMQ